jgi:hypothetical protein
VKVNPLVGIALDHAIDAATSGPSESELIRDNNRAHAVTENGLTAAIVQGYADNGTSTCPRPIGSTSLLTGTAT